MKEGSSKKQKKKAIPHCFQKRSRSNTSLSQILWLGKYKKLIKDLARNNRLLAVELSNLRLENARLNNNLKDCNKNNHQIMFARLKLKEMANTIEKLVTDMAEVNSYLDGNWEIHLQDKASHEKLRIKSPAVSCIEELSPAIETPSRENDTEAIRTSDQEPSENNSENQILSEMPPILFIEDSGEINKENSTSSSSKRSKRSNVTDQGSLTPKLDVDLSILNRRRTSSRRQTQKFIFPEPRQTRSRGKTVSSGRTNESPESSSPIILNEQTSAESIPIQNHKIFESIEQTNCKDAEIIAPNLCIDTLNNNDHINACDIPVSLNFPANEKTHAPLHSQRVDLNHTVLLCEDMELTDVVHPCFPIVIGNNLPTLDTVTAFNNTEIKSNVEQNYSTVDSEMNSVLVNPLQNNNDSDLQKAKGVHNFHVEGVSNPSDECEKNNSPSDDRPVFSDLLSPLPHQSTHQQKSDSFCEKISENAHKEAEQFLNDSISPFPIKLRHPRPLNYRNVFFSDESDQDSTPVKKQKKNESKEKGENSKNKTGYVSVAGSSKMATTILTNNFNKATLEDGNKRAKNDFSVYDLDVSNSEVKKSQKSKINKSKKNTKEKGVPKPLMQNCKVTKLKSGNYKFSKFELTDTLKTDEQQLKSKPVLEVSSTDDALNVNSTDIGEKKDQSKLIRKSILSTNKFTDNTCDNSGIRQQGTPKSEAKRVSFATTDTVCSYRKMSVSRVISENEKVRRVSKCVKEAGDGDALKYAGLDIATGSTVNNEFDVRLDLNSSEETELYIPPLSVCLAAAAYNNNPYSQKRYNSNNQGEKLKPTEMEPASKSQTVEMCNQKDALCVESHTATEISTPKEMGTAETSYSDETEIYTLPSNSHLTAENNLHPSLRSNISSLNKNVEDVETVQINDKDNLERKSNRVTLKKQKDVSEKNARHVFKSSNKIKEKSVQKNTLDFGPNSTTETVTEKKVASKGLLKLDTFCSDTKAVSHHPSLEPSIPSATKYSNCEPNNDKLTCKVNHLTKDIKNKQEKISKSNSVKSASKFSDESGEASASNNILGKCKEKMTANESTTNVKLSTKKLFNSSEFHKFQFNTFASDEDDDFQSSQPTISSIIQQPGREHCKENLMPKNDHLTKRTQKKSGKLSLKENKISQKEIPDKTMVKRDFQSVAATEDKFVCNSSCDNIKENEIHSDWGTMDIPRKVKVKSKHLEVPLDVLPANEGKNSIDAKCSEHSLKASTSKKNQSSKRNAIQSSPNTLKNKGLKSSLQFSPVLKDVANLEESTEDKLPKRRSRTAVNYKEPSLHKKMRRE